MAIAFSPDAEKHYQTLVARYEDRQAALGEVLHMAQREFHTLTDEVQLYVAERLELTPSTVRRMCTFYTMYNTTQVGKYHVQVCTNLSCALLGGERLFRAACEHLGVEPGELTDDQKFTVSEVECLASCGSAPAVQINDDYYENLTEERLIELLDSLD